MDSTNSQEILPSAEVELIQVFDSALATYIASSNRLFFADQPQTWKDFHLSTAGSLDEFVDYSPYELCEEFIREVLPHIYSFKLTPKEIMVFDLLKLHNEYKQVGDGFVRIQKSLRLTFCREIKLNVDYRVESHTIRMANSPDRECTTFSIQPSQPRSLHTVVLRYPLQLQQGGYNFRFSDETKALLSAALSNDFELSCCLLYTPKELHERLRGAKKVFEQTGTMPENCLSSNALLDKIHKLHKLRESLSNLMDYMFI